MFIQEIILDGFKSYATRTVVSGFDPMFNAITGLNGSGKSNILDSICFVLGISNLQQVRVGNLSELVYKQGQAGVTKATVTIVFNNSDPTTCLNDVIRAHTTGSGAGAESDVAAGIAREELLARFFNQFENLRSTFVRDGGFGAFVREYTDSWLHSGQEVMVEQAVVGETAGASSASEPVLRPARIVGISEGGNLTVQFVDTNGAAAAAGPVEEVIPDTTSLDMLQGLVTRKRTPAPSQ